MQIWDFETKMYWYRYINPLPFRSSWPGDKEKIRSDGAGQRPRCAAHVPFEGTVCHTKYSFSVESYETPIDFVARKNEHRQENFIFFLGQLLKIFSIPLTTPCFCNIHIRSIQSRVCKFNHSKNYPCILICIDILMPAVPVNAFPLLSSGMWEMQQHRTLLQGISSL